jgi:hypothetical protein
MVELIIFLNNGIKQLQHQTIDRSRPIGTIIVHTQLRGRMHMICISIFCFCLIARHLDILRYFIFCIFALLYCETLGRGLKQEGVYVKSLSCMHL